VSVESKVGRPDFDRTNLEREVLDWCQSHGVTKDELRDAVREVQSFMETLEIVVDHRTDASTSAPGARGPD